MSTIFFTNTSTHPKSNPQKTKKKKNTYTKLAEKNKHTKYDDLASKLDCRVVAAAFTTYGGCGDDFKKTLVDPYYKKEFKAARKNGESGCWAVINDRLRYERHVSAVICRENSRMLGSTLDARCRARAIRFNPTLCTATVSGSG